MVQAASILGLDIGDVRVGVAKAYWPDGIPSPLTVLTNDKDLSANLQKIIEDENAKYVIAGYPRSLNGNLTQQSNKTVNLVNMLKSRISARIILQDEAGTSIKAENELKSRKHPYSKEDIDSLSAVFILEDFINSHPGGGGL